MRYTDHYSTKKTPQSEQAKSTQVKNSAGGFTFTVDSWTQLDRFLILGTEGGSYYATVQKLTRQNAKAVEKCIEADGLRTVARIIEISDEGRAPKNGPALFALAMCAKLGDDATRKAAFTDMHKVARIGTHLFNFAQYIEGFGGWGRATKRAFADWYNKKPLGRAAYQAVKYQSRDDWSHRDILRLAKPKAASEGHNALFKWITKGELNGFTGEGLEIVHAFEAAKKATDKKQIVKLIQEHNLPRECIPTQYLTEVAVWDALLQGMPMGAMVRNLANMTRIGLLKPMSAATKLVVDRLADKDRMSKARMHPIAVLSALRTYESNGQSYLSRSKHTWKAIGNIVDALDGAFYLSFKAVEPANKRTLLALDVSGSMGGGDIAGCRGLTPRVGSAAMALITAATEKQHQFVAFTGGSGGWGSLYGSRFGRTTSDDPTDCLTELSIGPRMRLDAVVEKISGLPFGGTDCALPMLWAEKKGVEVDTFVIYTDSETWAGSIHPFQALKQYRQRMGIPAKLVVVGMVSSEFTIADPSDAGMMDVVGFDTAAPAIINDFSRQ